MIKFVVTENTGEGREIEWDEERPPNFDDVFAEARRLMSAGAVYVEILSGEVRLLCMHHNDFGGHRITGGPRPDPKHWAEKQWEIHKHCKNGAQVSSRWDERAQNFHTRALWRGRVLQEGRCESLSAADHLHHDYVSAVSGMTREELDVLLSRTA